MEIYNLNNLSFTYPKGEEKALKDVNLTIKEGEFITLCGKSGCGKTTLLRLLKPIVAPYGQKSGKILFYGADTDGLDAKTQAEKIGFVMQNPENQIVTDKVWHELSFGLESLGIKTPEIRARVSEMASFFGIQNWFYKRTDELSGGQKQMLNLAAAMVISPKILILDEPTAMLDPISAGEFLQMLKKINQELGTTVLLAEHRLEEAAALSDRIVVMEGGTVIADSEPHKIGRILKENKWDMFDALPTPVRVFESMAKSGKCPVTVREGKDWLFGFVREHGLKNTGFPQKSAPEREAAVEVKEAFFRYEKNAPDVVKNLSLTLYKGEFLAVMGGNGTGKTTALSVISGINAVQRGEILIEGKRLSEIENPYENLLGVLPQEPKTLFTKNTVFEELTDMTDRKLSEKERENAVFEYARLCRLENLLKSHPYDLSGGEQQRAALCMILMKKPRILIMDEPTKGMDAHFKRIFAGILSDLQEGGASILMVSHDLEFCAEFADRCCLFFDGAVTAEGETREFFAKNCFYTTGANRMARELIPDAISAGDIISSLGGEYEENLPKEHIEYKIDFSEKKTPEKPQKKVARGIILSLLFLAVYGVRLFVKLPYKSPEYAAGGASILLLWAALSCFFPQKVLGTAEIKGGKKTGKQMLLTAFLILFVIPLTIFFGVYYLGDRKYYFISLLIVIETLLPFFTMFENRRAEAKEIVVISVLCALAVAGRLAFFMVPEFKPLLAIIILTGVCLGGEAGFLLGAMTGFVSNFFFGQGPWTPWQMFALGIVGFLAGTVFGRGVLKKTRTAIACFGFFAALIIYGGIMNPASVFMVTANPTKEMLYSAYLMGVPIDLIHAISTAFFLWFLAEPFSEKLERIKEKYGLLR